MRAAQQLNLHDMRRAEESEGEVLGSVGRNEIELGWALSVVAARCTAGVGGQVGLKCRASCETSRRCKVVSALCFTCPTRSRRRVSGFGTSQGCARDKVVVTVDNERGTLARLRQVYSNNQVGGDACLWFELAIEDCRAVRRLREHIPVRQKRRGYGILPLLGRRDVDVVQARVIIGTVARAPWWPRR